MDVLLTELMGMLATSFSGQPTTRAKLESKTNTILATNRKVFPLASDRKLKEALKDDAQFLPKAEEFGWEVAGANVVIP